MEEEREDGINELVITVAQMHKTLEKMSTVAELLTDRVLRIEEELMRINNNIYRIEIRCGLRRDH